LLLTDCDGVLTDGGVYYSLSGEELKRFSIRDGMGVERLRTLVNVDVGIITGEKSAPLQRRAEKLRITEVHMAAGDKSAVLNRLLRRRGLRPDQVAFIGDDTNDLPVREYVGLFACPADAIHFVRDVADYICQRPGGHGAFREFAEFLIAAQSERAGAPARHELAAESL
jgi:3-deoxy-D-manno-octulosonate 8-phosphate phosphatase (KDO 8-P phosphatase)